MTQLRGTARELSILGVVREILNEVGYERLTVDAVVTRAKASKATIYRKWPDKATLVAAAFDARAEELPPLPLGGETLREDLLAFVGMCVSLAETETLTSFVSVLIAAEEEPVNAGRFGRRCRRLGGHARQRLRVVHQPVLSPGAARRIWSQSSRYRHRSADADVHQ